MAFKFKDSPPDLGGQVTINHQRQLTINTEKELKAAIARTMRKHLEDNGRPMTAKEKQENLSLYKKEFGPHIAKMAAKRAKRKARLAKERENG